jgi:hypothetical protein
MNPIILPPRPAIEEEDLYPPIQLPRRSFDWGHIAGLALMVISAMVMGFLMQILWRLAVLDHLALIH